MSDLGFVLNIPLVVGDSAAEIEEQIKDLAREFYGSAVELNFPTGYTAKPVASSYAINHKKAYEVRDLTVQRRLPSQWDSLLRTVNLPEVRADNAAGIQAEIDRLVREFFGSDDKVKVYGVRFGVLKASAPEDGEPRSDGKRDYCVTHVVAQKSGRWSTD